MRNQDRDAKIGLINRCVDLIENPEVVSLQVIKMFLKFLGNYSPRGTQWQNSTILTQK
jgi:hypothetical protein